MPEYIFVFIASGVFTLMGLGSRKFDSMDRRVDALELKISENYITKADFKAHQAALTLMLQRMEDKLDAHVSEEPARIQAIKRKYYN